MSDRLASGSGSPAADPVHFVQIGDRPAFVGTGSADLVCPCGQSVLIQGFLPRNFLAIRIRCFRCGAVSTTPGLPAGEVLPHDAVAVERRDVPAVTPASVSRGTVLACQQAMASDYVLTQPRDPPADPMELSSAVLDSCAAAYDRLTDGGLAEHIAAARRTVTLDASEYLFAWALLRLRERVGRAGWSWLYEDEDAMAAMHVAAFQHFLHCWGQHPRLALIASALAAPGRFLRTMTAFATAKLLFDSGNRIGFSLPSAAQPDAVPHFGAGEDEGLALAMRSPGQLQWRERERCNPGLVRSSVMEALASAQGQVNRNRPGILVLSASILQPGFDQSLVDAIRQVFRAVGRKHRGVAAIAGIVPHVVPVERPEQAGFGYGFYPMRNPHFAGENPIRMGSQQDFAALQPGRTSLV